MNGKTLILLFIFQLLASHIYFYRILTIENRNWKETINIGGSFITFSRNNQSGLIESNVDKFDNLAYARSIGFAHAKDRLSQMNQQRWVASGRLSECFSASEELKELDIFLRELGIIQKTENLILKKMNQQSIAYLEAYAEGVNAYLKRRKEDIDNTQFFHWITGAWLKSFIPLESTVIDSCGLTPWRPIDSLAIVGLMNYLGLAEVQIASEKFFFEALVSDVPTFAFKEIFMHYADVTDDLIEIYKTVNLAKKFIPKEIPILSSFPKFLASNNWVVAPKKSATGHAIQCNDPHLDMSRLPAIWYEYIHKADENSKYWYGVTVPGVPGFIMGRSKELSFGLTYGFMDLLDFFVEDVKDGKYRDGDEYKEFFRRVEIISGKDGSKTELLFLESQDKLRTLELDTHLASELLTSDGKLKIKDGKYLSRAFAWYFFEEKNFEVFYPLQATTVKDAQKILAKSPISANYLIADIEGNIGYQQSGLLPHRNNFGLFPLCSWEQNNTWRGVVDSSKLHSIYNPDEGFIATANNYLQAEGEDKPVSINLHMGPYRVQRASELLQAKEKLTFEDMSKIQADVYSKQAERYFKVIKPLLSHPSIDKRVREELSNWNFEYTVDSEAAVLFEEFLIRIFHEVFGPLFGYDVISQLFASRISILTVFMSTYDDVILDTPNEKLWYGENGRDEVFLKVLQYLTAQGEKYGEKHAIPIRNTYFQGPLSYYLGYSKERIPIPGGKQTLNAAARFTPKGYPESWFGASWRYIADLGNNFVDSQLPGGVSARRFSGLYENNLQDYLAHKYQRIYF